MSAPQALLIEGSYWMLLTKGGFMSVPSNIIGLKRSLHLVDHMLLELYRVSEPLSIFLFFSQTQY